MADDAAYHELCAYTLTHGDAAFIHQHVVDAFTAQQADGSTKPIALTFALAGLYLHVEKGLTGRQVQRIHMRMARARQTWPRFPLPADRGALTAADVIKSPAGPERDAAIDRWCADVWSAFVETRATLEELLKRCQV